MKRKSKIIFIKSIMILLLFVIIFLIFKIMSTSFFKSFVTSNIMINNYKYKTNITDILPLNKSIDINYKSNTSYIDIDTFDITSPLIYIYNTHQNESYYSPYIYDYSLKPNVMMASYMLCEELNNYNISSLVEKTNISTYMEENDIKMVDSYKASRYFLNKAINDYPSIKYFIDIHRDSLNIEKTLYEENNKRYAKVLFVIGKNNKYYKENSVIANKLNDLILKDKKDLTRGIEYKEGKYIDGVYNQDINSNVILLEIGGVENTIEEVNNTIKYIAKIISDFIGDENGK